MLIECFIVEYLWLCVMFISLLCESGLWVLVMSVFNIVNLLEVSGIVFLLWNIFCVLRFK